MKLEFILKFLKDILKNNDREWFEKNKPRYQEAKEGFENFVGAVLKELVKFDEGLTGLKSARDVKQRLGVWRDRVGKLLLSDLSVGTIKKHKDEIKATPKERGEGERSGADVNRTMAALSSALSFAVKELEWLEENPMKRVRKFAESRGRVRYLSEDELPALLKA